MGDKRNGTIADRRAAPPEWIVVGLVFFSLTLMIVAVAVGASLLRDVNNAVERIERVEAKNNRATRATAFRLCSRNAVDRAFAQSFSEGRERRALQDPHVLPILDCRPNLEGRGAEPLSPAAQDEFVRRWQQRKLSDVERGICPGSVIGEEQRPESC